MDNLVQELKSLKIGNLPNPSDEQNEIISCFKQGYNCKIEAVAGAGKTTTLLHLANEAKKCFNCKTLILTYNRDLKDEIQDKISYLQLNNYCNAYTYHGYASKIYCTNIHNDKILHSILHNEPKIISNYQIILLDEVQDMNPDYHKLVQYIIKNGDILILVGDRRQCINDYLQANTEYLINYNKYFNSGRPWKELSLRTSYRLTPYLSNFVNKHIIKEDVILPGNITNENIKPIYHYGVWDMSSIIRNMYEKYGPNEVIILVPSIKVTNNPKSPVGKLLSRRNDGILFHVKDEDSSCEIIQNKIVITSYNSMKGRERKCVILIGFDESYFEYYDRNWPLSSDLLPNIIYVAATRSQEQLIIIQDNKKLPFRTIDKTRLSIDTDIKGNDHDHKILISNNIKSRNIIDIIKHRNLSDILQLLSFIKIEETAPSGHLLPYQNIIQFNGYFEDMKQHYSTLIPLYSQYKRDNKIDLNIVEIDNIKGMIDVYSKYNYLLLKENKTIKEWMELCVMLSSINNKHHFYKEQITNFDWVDESYIIETSNRLLSTIPSIGDFSYPCSYHNIHGIIHYLTDNEIWEFKCTTSLTDNHIIQCASYISIHFMETGNLLLGKLFNLRTNEILTITLNDPISFFNILVPHSNI